MQPKTLLGALVLLGVLLGVILISRSRRELIAKPAPGANASGVEVRAMETGSSPGGQTGIAQSRSLVVAETHSAFGPRETAQMEVEAMRQGDVGRVAELIVFMPEAREVVEAARLTVSAELQLKYETPERFAAFIFCGAQQIESFEILAGVSEAPDFSIQSIRFKFESERDFREEDIAYYRTSDGWRRVIDVRLAQSIAAIAGSEPWQQE